ncbi:DUF4870 domain-containing protein [Carboxylicivirga sp. N1Y90]|uniref:DUF4870 domain-containing protein n=1 Tax=Carboxylicivirga fragile TaxID=3417571 RepID=UPI003D338890|nr:hypothetical protein [Marinilabiliaceae bacterium N1Y90]
MNEQSRTIAIVSYVTIIGWIIALIMRQSEKPQSELSRFHLRQALGINLIGFALSIVHYVLTFVYLGFIGNILGFVLFILWLIGLIGAIQGQFRYVPFLGRWFEENFDFVR